MAFSRMWNYVSGWTPFRAQTSARIAMDKDPGVTLLRQQYQSVLDSLKSEERKEVERLLKLSYENLKVQFTAKQQYKGDAVQNLIDKHLELLTTKETTTSPATEPGADAKTSVAKESSQAKPSSPAKTAAQAVSADSEIATKQIVSNAGKAKAAEEKAVKSKDVSGSTGLSSAELTSALDAFEASLSPGAGAQPLEVKEETLTPGKAIITGGRGNPYYEEELRRAVDESMEGDKKDVKPAVCPAKPKDPENISVKDATGPSKPASDLKPSTEPTKPAAVIKAVDPVPQKPPTATEINTGKSQTTPEKTGTGLSKEEISKSLDIFSASLEDEIPDVNTLEDIEVVSKSQATGRAKPAVAEEEEKVVKVSKTTGATNLSKDEIASALDAFESSLGDDLGAEGNLFSSNLVADVRDVKDATVNEEETLKPGKAVITGGRGNPYYEEELRKAVDESMGADKETKPAASPVKDSANISAKSVVDPAKPVVSPQKDSTNVDVRSATDPLKPLATSDKDAASGKDKTDVEKEKSAEKPKSATADSKDKQPAATPASTGSPQKVDEKATNAGKSDTKPVHRVSGEAQHKDTEGKQHSSDGSKDIKSTKEVKPAGEPTEKKLKPDNIPNQQPAKTDGKTDKKTAPQTKPTSDSKPQEHPKTTDEKK